MNKLSPAASKARLNYMRVYRATHHVEILEQNRQWRKNNLEKTRR